ncbi:hypothetical protein ADK35_42965 [Streptomyces viridochromogenes]|nr:hypothetical protein ADK35_42965 [Streptomyces viridochromogenes]KOG12685.1 hypothetical protein ADK36_33985 [Streptomyces viridochromogenes]
MVRRDSPLPAAEPVAVARRAAEAARPRSQHRRHLRGLEPPFICRGPGPGTGRRWASRSPGAGRASTGTGPRSGSASTTTLTPRSASRSPTTPPAPTVSSSTSTAGT